MLSFPSLLFSDSFSHQPNKPFHIEKQKTKNSSRTFSFQNISPFLSFSYIYIYISQILNGNAFVKVVEREKVQNNNNNSKN